MPPAFRHSRLLFPFLAVPLGYVYFRSSRVLMYLACLTALLAWAARAQHELATRRTSNATREHPLIISWVGVSMQGLALWLTNVEALRYSKNNFLVLHGMTILLFLVGTFGALHYDDWLLMEFPHLTRLMERMLFTILPGPFAMLCTFFFIETFGSRWGSLLASPVSLLAYCALSPPIARSEIISQRLHAARDGSDGGRDDSARATVARPLRVEIAPTPEECVCTARDGLLHSLFVSIFPAGVYYGAHRHLPRAELALDCLVLCLFPLVFLNVSHHVYELFFRVRGVVEERNPLTRSRPRFLHAPLAPSSFSSSLASFPDFATRATCVLLLMRVRGVIPTTIASSNETGMIVIACLILGFARPLVDVMGSHVLGIGAIVGIGGMGVYVNGISEISPPTIISHICLALASILLFKGWDGLVGSGEARLVASAVRDRGGGFILMELGIGMVLTGIYASAHGATTRMTEAVLGGWCVSLLLGEIARDRLPRTLRHNANHCNVAWGGLACSMVFSTTANDAGGERAVFSRTLASLLVTAFAVVAIWRGGGKSLFSTTPPPSTPRIAKGVHVMTAGGINRHLLHQPREASTPDDDETESRAALASLVYLMVMMGFGRLFPSNSVGMVASLLSLIASLDFVSRRLDAFPTRLTMGCGVVAAFHLTHGTHETTMMLLLAFLALLAFNRLVIPNGGSGSIVRSRETNLTLSLFTLVVLLLPSYLSASSSSVIPPSIVALLSWCAISTLVLFGNLLRDAVFPATLTILLDWNLGYTMGEDARISRDTHSIVRLCYVVSCFLASAYLVSGSYSVSVRTALAMLTMLSCLVGFLLVGESLDNAGTLRQFAAFAAVTFGFVSLRARHRAVKLRTGDRAAEAETEAALASSFTAALAACSCWLVSTRHTTVEFLFLLASSCFTLIDFRSPGWGVVLFGTSSLPRRTKVYLVLTFTTIASWEIVTELWSSLDDHRAEESSVFKRIGRPLATASFEAFLLLGGVLTRGLLPWCLDRDRMPAVEEYLAVPLQVVVFAFSAMECVRAAALLGLAASLDRAGASPLGGPWTRNEAWWTSIRSMLEVMTSEV